MKRIYPFYCGVCKNCKGKIMAKNHGQVKPHRQFCSKSCHRIYKNKVNNPAWRFDVKEKIAQSSRRLKGIRKPNGFAEKLRNANLGEKSHFWKGGITPINIVIRMSLEYKLWRTAVLERDNYTCIWCNKKGGWNKEEKRRIMLQADHIKPFCLYPELRFAIDNGRTLCKDCHKTTETWGYNIRFYKNTNLEGEK
jgi:hypothetical protein